METYLQRNCIGQALLLLPRNERLTNDQRFKLCHEIIVNEIGTDRTKLWVPFSPEKLAFPFLLLSITCSKYVLNVPNVLMLFV